MKSSYLVLIANGKLDNVFDEIYMQPARKNCALLSSKSAVKILDGVDK